MVVSFRNESNLYIQIVWVEFKAGWIGETMAIAGARTYTRDMIIEIDFPGDFIHLLDWIASN